MNQAEKDQLVSLLQSLLDQIKDIQRYDYQAAEGFYQRAKMFAEKYFRTQRYGIELIGIKFKPTMAFFEKAEELWETGTTSLQSIAQAMLDDTLLTPNTLSAASPVVTVGEHIKKVEALQSEVARLQSELQSSQTDLINTRAALADITIRRNRAKKFSIYLFAFLLSSFILWTSMAG